jgi:excisionase family DNA binding protein
MKVYHDSEIDYLSIDFTNEVDITDTMKLFASSDMMTLQEACVFLGISESTMRRKIRDGKVKFIKLGKDYRFKKVDIINIAA